jgi:HSP20 family molecular chaperone IbpA
VSTLDRRELHQGVLTVQLPKTMEAKKAEKKITAKGS